MAPTSTHHVTAWQVTWQQNLNPNREGRIFTYIYIYTHTYNTNRIAGHVAAEPEPERGSAHLHAVYVQRPGTLSSQQYATLQAMERKSPSNISFTTEVDLNPKGSTQKGPIYLRISPADTPPPRQSPERGCQRSTSLRISGMPKSLRGRF